MCRTLPWFRFQEEIIMGPTHSGTHLDAPLGISKKGWSVAEIPPERLLFVPIALVDISQKAFRNSSYQFSLHDIKRWEEDHGLVPKGAFFIVRTGWFKVSSHAQIATE